MILLACERAARGLPRVGMEFMQSLSLRLAPRSLSMSWRIPCFLANAKRRSCRPRAPRTSTRHLGFCVQGGARFSQCRLAAQLLQELCLTAVQRFGGAVDLDGKRPAPFFGPPLARALLPGLLMAPV